MLAQKSVEHVQVPLYRRFFTHPAFYQYRLLAALAMLVNLCFFLYGLSVGWWWPVEPTSVVLLIDMTLVNLAAAILTRQQYVINFVFWIATLIPKSWPLWVRWTAGKVYHFGGLHSGYAISATFWLAGGVAGAVHLAWRGDEISRLTIGSGLFLVVIFIAMILTAFGPWRHRRHNLFEATHRFGGLVGVALIWLFAISALEDLGKLFLASPIFWMLCLLTASILLPWLRLKKVKVKIERPSDHAAILELDYGDEVFTGSTTSLSRNPLFEWHGFATLPPKSGSGYRVIVSRAGDWTGRFIDDAPEHLWVRGVITAGIGRIDVLFKRVVYVATGSGIGPVIQQIIASRIPISLIWSTRNPQKTYGSALCSEILDACPNTLIWDTDSQGKPDLLAMTAEAVHSFNAEAVIVVSNPNITWKIVTEMERRDIPAFGAIWDS